MWTGGWTGSRQDRVAGPCAPDVTPKLYKTQVILETSWLNFCHVISDEQTSTRKDNTLYDSHKVYCYQSWTTFIQRGGHLLRLYGGRYTATISTKKISNAGWSNSPHMLLGAFEKFAKSDYYLRHASVRPFVCVYPSARNN
jgi:hypothetical protein